MPLVRLTYFSENLLDPSRGSVVAQLSAILSAANRNNRLHGITGALVFDDLWFLQILEGERADVLRTFKAIAEDDRHRRVTPAEMCDVGDRMFENWWMGLARRDEKSERVFRPFLIEGRLQPDLMRACDILKLIVGVATLGLNRNINAAAA